MKTRIWQEDEEYSINPVTNEAVVKAEEKLKVKFPESYISILKEQNGGYIIYDSYPTTFPNSWAEDHINVDCIKGIGGEESILESEYLIEEWGLPEKTVLISGDGHTWVALDYRKTSVNPSVIFIDVEAEQIVKIAESFKEFLSKLYNEEEIENEELKQEELEAYEDIPDDVDLYIKE
ncbi:SMI1/KNR4 family protein [Ralstonia pickettii]|nr:SMI1/KNR4 family protein [Ralstonia pickettii]